MSNRKSKSGQRIVWNRCLIEISKSGNRCPNQNRGSTNQKKNRDSTTADPERTEEILVQTFDERLKWVTGDNGPKITEVVRAYPEFHTDTDQVKPTGL